MGNVGSVLPNAAQTVTTSSRVVETIEPALSIPNRNQSKRDRPDLAGTLRKARGTITLSRFAGQLRVDRLIALHDRRQCEVLLHAAPGGHSKAAPYPGPSFD